MTTGMWEVTPRMQAAREALGDAACSGATRGDRNDAACWRDVDLASNATWGWFKSMHDRWFEGIASLKAKAPVLWLNSEEVFKEPEAAAARVFDFVGIGSAAVSGARAEEAFAAKMKGAGR